MTVIIDAHYIAHPSPSCLSLLRGHPTPDSVLIVSMDVFKLLILKIQYYPPGAFKNHAPHPLPSLPSLCEIQRLRPTTLKLLGPHFTVP